MKTFISFCSLDRAFVERFVESLRLHYIDFHYSDPGLKNRYFAEDIKRAINHAFLALAAVLATGCGPSSAKLAPVSGTVSVDGRPVNGATVELAPKDGGRPAMGTTDKSGRFRVTTFTKNDGAIVGEHAVTIRLVERVHRKGSSSEQEYVKWIIPQRYSRAETSGLTARVSRPSNHLTYDLTTLLSGEEEVEAKHEVLAQEQLDEERAAGGDGTRSGTQRYFWRVTTLFLVNFILALLWTAVSFPVMLLVEFLLNVEGVPPTVVFHTTTYHLPDGRQVSGGGTETEYHPGETGFKGRAGCACALTMLIALPAHVFFAQVATFRFDCWYLWFWDVWLVWLWQ